MADPVTPQGDKSISALVSGIFEDTQGLIKQHISLAKTEFRAELNNLKTMAIGMAIGGGVAAIGAIFILVGVVHWVADRFPDLGYTGAYLVVGLVMAVIGVVTFLVTKKDSAKADLIPDRTIEKLQTG